MAAPAIITHGIRRISHLDPLPKWGPQVEELRGLQESVWDWIQVPSRESHILSCDSNSGIEAGMMPDQPPQMICRNVRGRRRLRRHLGSELGSLGLTYLVAPIIEEVFASRRKFGPWEVLIFQVLSIPKETRARRFSLTCIRMQRCRETFYDRYLSKRNINYISTKINGIYNPDLPS